MSSTSSSCRTGPPQAGQAPTSVRLTRDAAAALRLAVPHRDAVAPPELPRDAPVADALEPVLVLVAPTLGDEAGGSRRATARARGGRAAPSARTTGRRAAARPPCRSGSSAPPRAGAARPSRAGPAASNSATTRSRASKRSRPWNRSGAARLIRASGVMTSMDGQAVAPADLEVGRVVRRRDLHGPGAEGRIHGVVGHDRDQPIDHRQPELAADQVAVALVLGMHRHGHVAEHRLGTRRGHGDVPAPVGERVAQVPELPVRLLLLRFLVGEGGEAARAPVDDVVPAVDESRLVQARRTPRARRARVLVQREVGARPVGGAADGLELLEDRGAGLVARSSRRARRTLRGRGRTG